MRFDDSNYFKRIGALQTSGHMDQDVQVRYFDTGRPDDTFDISKANLLACDGARRSATEYVVF